MRIINIEEIQAALLAVPKLIDALDKHDPDFLDNVKLWLTNTEQILLNNRLAAGSELATLRGVLISAERGLYPTGIVLNGRITPRKIKEATAADVLKKGSDLVANLLKPHLARIADAEQMTRQLVALAQRKGTLNINFSGAHTDRLNIIWQAMSADPDLAGGTVHLTGLVGPYDALVMLDRMLAQF